MTTRYLKIGEVAAQTGVSIRSLHFYEEKGLMRPPYRSPAGYRMYGEEDLMQLQKIKSLQKLGLSLKDIQHVLLSEWDSQLDTILTQQIDHIRQQIVQQELLLTQLMLVVDMLADNLNPSIDMLINTLKLTVTYEKYFSKEDLKKFEVLREQKMEADRKAIEDEWMQIFADFEALRVAGKPPACPQAQKLAVRSHELLDEFTGHDPKLRETLDTMYRTEGGDNVLQGYGIDMTEVRWTFLREAMRINKHGE